MEKEKAQKIYNHLISTGQYWCFVDGVVTDREYLESVLDKSDVYNK